MRKIFLISGVLLSLVVIFFLAVIFISTNPDHLKPLITAQIEKYTQCEIKIDDHLSLSFFPYFGVKAKHIQIMTPKGSEVSDVKIDIRNAVAQLELMSLLRGKIKTGTIQIDELTLDQRTFILKINLNNIRFEISPLDKSEQSFLTTLSFNFAENSFLHSGRAVISGDVAIDMMHQTASWKNIHAVVLGLTLNGELNAKNIFNNPDVSGNFTLESSNLKAMLNQINLSELKTENIPDINTVHADINLFANIESFSMQSNLQIKNIQASKINIDDINARLYFKNNIINMEFINASAYGGDFNGEASINLNAYRPVITAHVKALNVQIEPLFKLMQVSQANIYPDTKMTGAVNMELEASTIGGEVKSLLNNLKGTGHLSISNGLFMGKDWDEMVARLDASKSQNLRIFRFKQLSASFKINNGIFFSDDLWVNSSDINIKGKGQINFPNNFIDYVLQAEFQNNSAYNGIDSNSAKMVLATIPVRGVLAL